MGGEIFPHEWIVYSTYKITPNRRFDLDSTRTANGELLRYVLNHTATTIQFTIRSLEESEQYKFGLFVHGHYSNSLEKKSLIEYWSPDISDYKEGEFYVPDVEWTVRQVKGNRLWYRSFNWELIEY